MEFQNQIQRAQNFLKEFQGETPAIIYHGDCDGMCSAAILIMTLGLRESPILLSPKSRIRKSEYKDILKSNPKLIIFLDLGNVPYSIFEGMPILNIDHHIINKFDIRKDIIYVNPRIDGKNSSNSFITYQVCKEIDPNIKKFCKWLAALGIESDKTQNEPMCRDFLKELYMENGKFKEKVIEYISLISSTRSVGKPHQAVNVLIDACLMGGFSSLPETLGYKKLINYRELTEREIKRLIWESESRVETYNNLHIYEIDSSLDIQSYLCSKLIAKVVGTTVLIVNYGLDSELAFCNFRSRLNIMPIIKEVIKKMPVIKEYGGHENAAGITLKKKDYKIFIKLLKKNFCSI
jgi:single-stranded DNA-specific DHH superfamily exonuclease